MTKEQDKEVIRGTIAERCAKILTIALESAGKKGAARYMPIEEMENVNGSVEVNGKKYVVMATELPMPEDKAKEVLIGICAKPTVRFLTFSFMITVDDGIGFVWLENIVKPDCATRWLEVL